MSERMKGCAHWCATKRGLRTCDCDWFERKSRETSRGAFEKLLGAADAVFADAKDTENVRFYSVKAILVLELDWALEPFRADASFSW